MKQNELIRLLQKYGGIRKVSNGKHIVFKMPNGKIISIRKKKSTEHSKMYVSSILKYMEI